MTAWLQLTPEPLFDFYCLHLWNISKTDMVHLVWEGVSTDGIRQNLEIQSPFIIPEVGHLITCCSSDLHTADYEGGLLTNVNIGSDWYAGFLIQSLKFKITWYLFQAWKSIPRHDTMKCLSFSQSYITILSIEDAVQSRPHTDHTDTDFPDNIKGYCSSACMFTFTVSPGLCRNCKLGSPSNYWNNWSLETCHSGDCNF